MALPAPAPDGSAANRPGVTRTGLSRWVPRVIALAALALTAIAVVVAVGSVHSKPHGLSEADASRALIQLSSVNGALSSKLRALQPGQSAQAAQDANRTAYAVAKRLQAQTPVNGELGVSVHQVLAAQLKYDDAVGSAMYNPSGPLVAKIVPYANALRQALQDTPGGDSTQIDGAQNFVAYCHARATAKH